VEPGKNPLDSSQQRDQQEPLVKTWLLFHSGIACIETLDCVQHVDAGLLVALQASHSIRIEVVAAVWKSSMRHV
jgi:hypothetical protein